ncbi:MAG: hypothetical protein HY319_13350 [Armatimonadetes bacterium]|nr:hypothetical protein [Armatimonadota bacterium]
MPVSDEFTAHFIHEFYQAAQTVPAPRALAELQRHWLAKLRAERGLLSAVNLAGPFVLTSRGSPEKAGRTVR